MDLAQWVVLIMIGSALGISVAQVDAERPVLSAYRTIVIGLLVLIVLKLYFG